jgi:hypothetical protein
VVGDRRDEPIEGTRELPELRTSGARMFETLDGALSGRGLTDRVVLGTRADVAVRGGRFDVSNDFVPAVASLREIGVLAV